MSPAPFLDKLHPLTMAQLWSKIRSASHTLRFWVLFVIALIVTIIVYVALLDRFTPYTNDGYVQSYVVQIAPQVEGPVLRVFVQNNTFVKKGTPLFQIDPEPFEYEVARLRAEVGQAIQTVRELQSEVKRSKAHIAKRKADLVYAERHYEEIKPLAEKQYAAQLQLQQVTDDLRSKRALLNEAAAQREKSEAALSVTLEGEHAQVRLAEAELALAEYNLRQTTVYSPFDAYITNLQLTEGAYVAVGSDVITLVDANNWWLVANFRENSLRNIEPGQPARVALGMYPGRVFDAYVESVDWGVSSGQGTPSGDLPTVTTPVTWFRSTQRFPVRLRIRDEESPVLRVGGRVTVTVVTDERAFLWNGLARLWLRIGSWLDFL